MVIEGYTWVAIYKSDIYSVEAFKVTLDENQIPNVIMDKVESMTNNLGYAEIYVPEAFVEQALVLRQDVQGHPEGSALE